MRTVAAEVSPQHLQWRRVRRALEGFPATMLRFIEETYGSSAIHEAWAEYSLWDDSKLESDTPHMQVFMSWFFHQWAPDPCDTTVGDQSLHDRPPTRLFLDQKGMRLDPVLHRYLQACLRTAFSFHDIVQCDPGVGFLARDVITGESCEVLERSASQTLRVGDIIFAQLVSVDEIVMLEACSPAAIPPGRKVDIVRLRSRISPTAGDPVANDLHRESDMELRGLYLGIADEILHPRVPELRNTDGDKLENPPIDAAIVCSLRERLGLQPR